MKALVSMVVLDLKSEIKGKFESKNCKILCTFIGCMGYILFLWIKN